jgi:hypothetical protein
VRAGLEFSAKLEEAGLPVFYENGDTADAVTGVIKGSFANGLTIAPMRWLCRSFRLPA